MAKDLSNKINKIFSDSDNSDDAKSFFLEAVAKFCERCGNLYQLQDINVVKRTQGQVLLQIKCPNCGSSHIVSFIQPLGVSSKTPFQTDLTIDELKKYSNMDAVASNEVLDVYEYLDSQKEVTAGKLLKQLDSKDSDTQDLSLKKS